MCGSIGLSVAAHNSLCTGHILTFANEEQKQKYLPKLATGRMAGRLGVNRTQYGQRCRQYENTAVKDGDNWIINGTKNWITQGAAAM